MTGNVKRTVRWASACWLVLAAGLTGCEGRRLVLNREYLDRGLIIVLPGIDGRAPHNEAACLALRGGGPDMAVELYDWTAPLGALYNQCAVDRNHEAATRLARRIQAYTRDHPRGRVFLAGHSGGTALAVWAAEALPEGQEVDGLVLLASSLSPSYDLSGALSKSRHGIVSFYSPRDSILLGFGTSTFGTMDRQYTEAAGRVGFRRPGSADRPELYAKLVQIEWEEQAAEAGNDGGHFSCLAGRFIEAYVVPFLGSEAWGRSLVADRGRRARPASSQREVALATVRQ